MSHVSHGCIAKQLQSFSELMLFTTQEFLERLKIYYDKLFPCDYFCDWITWVLPDRLLLLLWLSSV